jgi:hypothetical protein
MGRTAAITRRHRSIGALILTGTLVLAACSGGDDADMAAEPAAEEFDGNDAASEPAEASTADRSEGAPGIEAGDTGFDLGAIGRDVIIEMRVLMSSDDIQRTVASITANASTLGGGIASSDVRFGDTTDPENAYAILVVKVPPTAVDRLLSGLDDAGTVQSINQSAQDVTEQLVDLDVRIANARQSVANVREFMDRTENLNELVTLEGELTRRQTELERLEAQQRNLSDRVALSTITVEVVPTASVPAVIEDEPDTIGDAFERGWDAFTSFVFAIGYVLAVTLPFLSVGTILALSAWIVARRRRPDLATPAAAGPPPRTDPPQSPGPSGPPPSGDGAVSDDEIATPVG